MMHILLGRCHHPSLGVEHLVIDIPRFHKILPVAIVRYRLIGKLGHDTPDGVPLVLACYGEAIDVLLNKVYDIAAFGTVTVKKRLVSLALGVSDNHSISVATSPVGQRHLDEFANTSRSYQPIAQ